ncbi:hypothetical protein C882_0021 [Caenispirillum salinarum AK4]|uniref:Uncharacterized protein n=1 Tax=Caenispirillum salinarum AK4 TaxID=1238182 RepID=K9HRL6_9PROT|nr:hypothetical protein [Caenispirillum salinarum]EKV32938.1 hypothetical protein C882_0021 [Caenispirillum salinarum AK4]
MADETINPGNQDAEGTQGQQDASEGLHIHGRGHEALEDGAEQPANAGDEQGREDFFGNANVQTGRRSTFEGTLDGQPDPGETVADQSPVVGGDYTPEDPDGNVAADFDAVQPDNGRGPGPAADGEEEDEDDAEDEEGQRDPGLERPEDRVPGDGDDTGGGDEAAPGADPAAPAFAATEPPAGDADTPADGSAGEDEDEPDPVAETPTVTAADADGVEDQPIRLDLTAALTDIDGTETLTVTLAGLPDGFSLSDGTGAPVGTSLGGGAWSVPPGQLDDLFLVRPEHFSGEVPLSVTATATEVNGETSTVTTDFTVTVEAVADAPVLDAEDVAGTENEWHDLSISAALVDADGSESLTVYVTDVPPGATLDQGTRLDAPVTLANGTVLAAGTWTMTAEQAESVRIMPPQDDSADFTLRVFAETEEDSNGDRAVSGPAEINVDVGVVAPSVSGTGTGAEDTWVQLDLSAGVNAELGDESLQVLLENLPEGALLRVGGQLVTDTGGPVDISGNLDAVEVRWDPATDLHSDADITFQLRAIVRDADVGTDTETPRDTNQTVTNVTVDVTGVADPLTLSASGSGNEDSFGGAIAVPVTVALTDTDGSESLTGSIDLIFDGAEQGVLTGPNVTTSTDGDGNTVYSIAVDAANVSFDAATATYSVGGLVFEPETDSDNDVTFSVRATTLDSDGSTRTDTQAGQTITIDAVADAPTVAANPEIGGSESAADDAWIDVDITDLGLTDDTNESLTLYVGGVPAGGALMLNGTVLTAVDAAGIEFTGVDTANAPAPGLSGDVYALPGFDPATDRLQVRPPTNSSADFDLRLVAMSDEANGTDQGNAVERNWSATDVQVDVAVLAPEIGGTLSHTGAEGAWTALDGLQVDLPAQSAGLGEETVTITLSGDALADANIRVVDADSAVVASKTGTETSFTIPAENWDPATGALTGVEVQWKDGDRTDQLTFDLTAHVVDIDQSGDFDPAGSTYADEASATRQVTVDITAVVDAATVSADDDGTEDAGTPGVAGDGIALDPVVQLSGDASESLTGEVVLSFDAANAAAGTVVWVPATGGPADVLNANADNTEYRLDASVFVNDGSGRLTIDPAKGSLQFVPVEHFDNNDADVTYGMEITVSDGTETATFTGTGRLTIDAEADPVQITASGIGNEDSFDTVSGTYTAPIDVPVSIQLTDTDGSEDLSGTIDLVFDGAEQGELAGPNVSRSTDGDGNTVYSIAADAANVTFDAATQTYSVSGLTFAPAEHSDADVSFTVRATSADNAGSTLTTTGAGAIAVRPVADRPDLDADSVGGTESAADDAWIGLDISALNLTDTDGSESLTLYVSGVPGGGALRLDPAASGATVSTVDAADVASVGVAGGTPDLGLSGTVYKVTFDAGVDPQVVADALQVRPPADSSADFDLRLAAIASEASGTEHGNPVEQNWNTADVHVDVGVLTPTVTADAQTPGAEGTGWTPLSGLNVQVPALTDGSSEETVTLTVSGPDLADATIRDADGNPLQAVPGTANAFVVPLAAWDAATGAISGLEVRWNDPDRAGTITFDLKAHVVDGDAGETWFDALGTAFADEAEASTSVSVDILPVSDGATLSGGGVGVEDQWTALNLSWSVNDASEEVTGVSLSGLPENTIIHYPDPANAGTYLSATAGADGTVALPKDLTAAQQADVYAEWPQHLSTALETGGTVELTLSVDTAEPGASNSAASTTTDQSFTVQVFGDADAATGATDATAKTVAEDVFYEVKWGDGLDVNAALADPNAETLSFLIKPEDGAARLKIDGVDQGTAPADGWSLTYDQLSTGKIEIAGPLHWGRSDDDPTQTFKVYAVTTEADAAADDSALDGVSHPVAGGLSREGVATVHIGDLNLAAAAVADAVSFAAASVADTMLEDNGTPGTPGDGVAIAPEIQLTDTDGSESLDGYLIFESSDAALLRGALTLNGTDLTAYKVVTSGTDSANPVLDESATVAEGDTFAFRVPVSALTDDGNGGYTLSGLTFVPEEHSDADVTYTLYATTKEADNGVTQVTRTDGTIDVTAVADPVTLTTVDTGAEEADVAATGIPLSLTTGLVDADGSETLTVFLTLPANADAGTVLEQNGTALSPVTDFTAHPALPDGPDLSGTVTYAFTIQAGDDPAAVLGNLVLKPPAGVSDDLVLDVRAVTVETDVNGVPRMAQTNDTLRIDIGTDDPTLTLTGDGGFTLLEGTNYEKNPWQAVDLTADLSASIDPALADGSETLTVRLYGLPDHVAVRYAGAGPNAVQTGSDADGDYVVIPADKLSTVEFRMTKDHRDQDFTLQAKAVVEDVDVGTTMETDRTAPWGDSAESPLVTLDVNVLARADNATIKVDGDGLEDSWQQLKLNISAKDGSEDVTSVVLKGIPSDMELRFDDGTTVTDVTVNADGTAELLLAGIDLADLKHHLQFRAGLDDSTYDGGIPMHVEVTTTENGTEAGDVNPGDETHVSGKDFTLDVWGVADTPELTLNTGDGGTPPTDGLPSFNNGHAISNIVLYLDDGTGTITKVKVDNFSGGGSDWNNQLDVLNLPLDAFIDQTYNGSTLAAITVKAGGNGFNKNDPDYMGPGEGDLIIVDGSLTRSDLPVGDADTVFGNPQSAFDHLAPYSGGSGSTTANTHTETIAEDGLFTLTLNGTNGLLQAETGEHGTGDAPTSTDGSETLEFRIEPVDGDHSRLLVDGDERTLENGAWFVTYDELSGGRVQIGGVDNWHSEAGLSFNVTVVAVEADADDPDHPDATLARADGPTRQIILKIEADADIVTVDSLAAGAEDQAVAMPLDITLDDADGSEALVDYVYLVTSDPDMLAGSLNGTWTGAAADLTFFDVQLDGSGKPVVDADGVVQQAAAPTGTYAVRVPAGAFTPPDTGNGEDTYTLPGLTFTPEAHSADEVTYKVYATTRDADGSRMTTIGDGSITLKAEADAPAVTVNGDGPADAGTVVAGDEDSDIALQIAAAPVDPDSEDLTHAELSGVPDGWVVGVRETDGSFSAATDNGNGVWVLDHDRLADVVVRPPLHLNVQPADAPELTLKVTSREDGSDVSDASDTDDGVAVRTAVTTKSFKVEVDAVADAPTLTVQPEVTAEEQAVKLDILPALQDTDGSETLSLFITGDFAGGSLTGAGVTQLSATEWQVDVDHLDDLYYVPAEDYSGTVNLQVVARATENASTDPSDDVADTVVALPIIVRGVADSLDDTTGITVTAAEDEGWFDPGLAASLTTKDMVGADAVGSESIAVVLKGLPDDVEIGMTAGNEDGLRCIGTSGGQPVWAVEAGYLEHVRLRVPDDWAGRLDVPMVVTVTEADGHSTETGMTLAVDVTPEADAPRVTLSGSNVEDAPAGASFTIASVLRDVDDRAGTDSDDYAESITGITLTVADAAFLADTPDLKVVIDGVEHDPAAPITISDANATVTLTGLPDGWSKDVPVQVTVETAEGGTTATTTEDWAVPIAADADPAETFDIADGPLSSTTGAPIDLDLDVLLGDTDGSEVSHVIVTGVTDGMKLVDASGATIGHDAGGGRWIVPATDATGAVQDLRIDGAPGTAASLSVTLMVTDIDPDGGRDVWMSQAETVDVSFDAGGTGGGSSADVGPVAVTMEAVSIDEDGSFLVNATVTPSGDDVADTVVIHGLSNAVRVVSENGAFNVFALDNGDGTSDYVIPVDALGNVRVHPPADSAEDFDLTLTATARDGYWTRESDPVSVPVEIAPVTETDGSIGTGVAAGADTTEDTAGIGVELTLHQADADRSEVLAGDTLTLDTSSVPDGSVITLGSQSWQTDGSPISVSLADFGTDITAANAAFQGAGGLTLTGLAVTPPADWHGKITLGVSAQVVDTDAAGDTDTGPIAGATWDGTVPITVTPETDGASPVAVDVTRNEDEAIPLDIKVATSDLKGVDTHGSELLSVVIEGVPAGMTILGASNNGSDDGGVTNTWTVKSSVLGAMAADGALSGLQLVAPPDWSDPDGLELTVRAYQFEAGTRDVVESADTFTVIVNPVADTPFVNPQDASGTEYREVPLDLGALSADFDGSETVTVTITGAPETSTFKATLDDGSTQTWTVGASGTVVLPVTGVAALSFVGPEDLSGEVTMTVAPTATDGTDTATGAAQSFTVSLAGDADAPLLTTPAIAPSGAEDTDVALNLSASLQDLDGSESLNLIIGPAAGAAIPADTVLVTASDQLISLDQNGTFSVSQADIPGLKLRAPADWHGTLDLTVTATATEQDGDAAATQALLTVTVTAAGDAPTADVSAAADYGVNDGHTGVLKVLTGSADPLISFADVDAALDPAAAVLSGLKVSLATTDGTDGLGLSGLPISFTSTGGLATTVNGKTFGLSWDGGSQTLSFSGAGDYADYQTLAESVILTNDNGTLTAGSRTVTFTAIDGDGLESTGATDGGLDPNVEITINGDKTVSRTADDLHFHSDGRASIAGSDGDDSLTISADSFSGVSGLGGFDILTVMANSETVGDWTFAIQDDGASVTATSGDETLDIVFTDGKAMEVDTEGDLVLEDDSSGTLTFEDGRTVDFEDLEKINGQF